MHFIKYIETVINIISCAIVVYGAVISFIGIIKTEFCRLKGSYDIIQLRVIRADLGTYLLLGLELLIAADILQTILEPSNQELLILGGIVLLRTILSYFLNKEIEEIDDERHEHPELFNR
ncbi:MAG: DUF1622 domain-containing protein [Treponemataceae bacterium]|nr:DUF1622 domain-containing protein [Treponemataceae bacterium]